MTDPQITYYHNASVAGIACKTEQFRIDSFTPHKRRIDRADGLTKIADKGDGFRRFAFNTKQTAAKYASLDIYHRQSDSTDYTSTYPNMLVRYNASLTATITCNIESLSVGHRSHDDWMLSMTIVERIVV